MSNVSKIYAYEGVAYDGNFSKDGDALAHKLINNYPEQFLKEFFNSELSSQDFINKIWLEIKNSKAFRSAYGIWELEPYQDD